MIKNSIFQFLCLVCFHNIKNVGTHIFVACLTTYKSTDFAMLLKKCNLGYLLQVGYIPDICRYTYTRKKGNYCQAQILDINTLLVRFLGMVAMNFIK